MKDNYISQKGERVWFWQIRQLKLKWKLNIKNRKRINEREKLRNQSRVLFLKADKTAINTKIISNKSHIERESSNPNFILETIVNLKSELTEEAREN